MTLELVFAGLVGGIVWNLLTWLLGIPSSSSHALIGGIVGAMIAAVGGHGVIWSGLVSKVIIPAVVAAVLATLVGAVGTWLVYRVTRGVPEQRSEQGFRRGQIGSAALVSLAHGTNDAQKTMGVIFLALMSYGAVSKTSTLPPLWVIVCCAAAIAAGTYFGGWRIIRTMGKGLVEIKPRRAWPPSRRLRPSFCCPPTSAMHCPPHRSPPDRCWAAGSANPAPRCAGA
ncbi:phosphate transporter family protein [Mycobacterium xenopi 4042]|uniref:Phosphate transporter family protein n=1 Tax=Mycobacterium xenopi 4042 TaxID=1299334 RepID=X8C7R9_MYCXE|nr:phosphate transporter family protein [Mycobacterium xenopi 4042]